MYVYVDAVDALTNIYIYIYVYLYVCGKHVHECVWIDIYIYKYVDCNMYVYICIYMKQICIKIHMWVYIFKTICKYVYIGIQIYACNATQCNDEYVFICVYTWIHMIFIYDLYIYTYKNSEHICKSRHKPMQIHEYLCKYKNVLCIYIWE